MQGIVLGDLEDAAEELVGEEPVSDLDVAAGALEGTFVEPEEVPLAIDELPLVALLGCFAEGETVVRGAQELRLKESDRIATVVDGLRGLGADIEATEDGFAVTGTGGLRGGAHRRARRPPPGDARRGRGSCLARGGRGARGWRLLRSPTRGSWRTSRRSWCSQHGRRIDGPAGAGKSTVARALARELGFTYLDSGAMYRCVALLALEPRRTAQPAQLARAAIGARGAAGPRTVLLDGRDVTEAIRAPEVTEAASRVAADPAVRAVLVAAQQRLIGPWRLGRGGTRHRHRRRPRRRAEGLPHGRAPRSERAGARPSWGSMRGGSCWPSRRCATSATRTRGTAPSCGRPRTRSSLDTTELALREVVARGWRSRGHRGTARAPAGRAAPGHWPA